MMGNIQSLDVQIPHEIVQYWGWFLAFGVGLLLLGVIAIVRSVTATIVSPDSGHNPRADAADAG